MPDGLFSGADFQSKSARLAYFRIWILEQDAGMSLEESFALRAQAHLKIRQLQDPGQIKTPERNLGGFYLASKSK